MVGALDLDIVSHRTYEQRLRDAASVEGWGRTAARASLRHGLFILNWCVALSRDACWAEAAAATLVYRHRASREAADELVAICARAGRLCLGLVAILLRAAGLLLQPFYLIDDSLHEETAEWTRGDGGVPAILEYVRSGDHPAGPREGQLLEIYGAIKLWAGRHRVLIHDDRPLMGWTRTAAHVSPADDLLVPCRVLVLSGVAAVAGDAHPPGAMPAACEDHFSKATHHVVALGDVLVSTQTDYEGAEAVQRLKAGENAREWVYKQIREVVDAPHRESYVTPSLKLSMIFPEVHTREAFMDDLGVALGIRLLEEDLWRDLGQGSEPQPESVTVLHRAVSHGNVNVNMLRRAIVARHGARLTQTLLDILERKSWRELSSAHLAVKQMKAAATGVRDLATMGEAYTLRMSRLQRRLKSAAATCAVAADLRAQRAAQYVLRTTQEETSIEVPDLSAPSVRGRFVTLVVRPILLVTDAPWAALCDRQRLRVGMQPHDAEPLPIRRLTFAEPEASRDDAVMCSAPRTPEDLDYEESGSDEVDIELPLIE